MTINITMNIMIIITTIRTTTITIGNIWTHHHLLCFFFFIFMFRFIYHTQNQKHHVPVDCRRARVPACLWSWESWECLWSWANWSHERVKAKSKSCFWYHPDKSFALLSGNIQHWLQNCIQTCRKVDVKENPKMWSKMWSKGQIQHLQTTSMFVVKVHAACQTTKRTA